MPACRVSVVVVTHRSREAIGRTLPALTAELAEDDELIVVDNDSDDGTPAAVRELAPQAKVIETGANLGFAGGCNAGAAAASGELLVLLNPDAVPAKGFREAIAPPARRRPRLVRLDGARHRRGRNDGEYARRRDPLHRDRLGGRGG